MSKNLVVGSCVGVVLSGVIAQFMPLEGAIMFGATGIMLATEIMILMMPLRGLFRNLGLHNKDGVIPDLRERRKSDSSTIYRFAIPPGLCLADFEKQQQEMENFLGKKVSLKYHSRNIIMEVFEKEIESIMYEPPGLVTGLSIPFGIMRNEKPIYLDMNIDPHCLIASETGGGKSTLLRILITTLILCTNSLLHLIDLKGGCELGIFEQSEKVGSFGRTAEEALRILKSIQAEVERRYQLFYDTGATNFNDYNKTSKEKLKNEILIFDEYAELVEEKECQAIVKSLCARARACGIFVIIATQRPEAKVLNGLIKCNILNVIGLRTKNELNSRLIIEEKGLERLRGKGHGLYQTGGKLTEFQAYNLTKEEAIRLIKPTIVSKVKKSGFPKIEKIDMSFLEG